MNDISYSIFVVRNQVVWFRGFVINRFIYILIARQIDLIKSIGCDLVRSQELVHTTHKLNMDTYLN